MPKSRSERVCILGTTGSGKTTLGQYISLQYPYLVVYDVKDDYYLPGVKRLKTLREVTQCSDRRIIYAPRFDEMNPEFIEAFFRFCYQRGQTAVHITEVYAVTEDEFPLHYRAILTRGRSRNVIAISESQRPFMIPQTIISESENIYTFRLNLPQDRNVVERITAIQEAKIQQLRKREFYYTHQGDGSSGPYTLRGVR